jgi:hypothetical protein
MVCLEVWDNALYVRRSWVRFLMVSLGFFFDFILQPYSDPGSSLLLTEMSTRNISLGVKVAGV